MTTEFWKKWTEEDIRERFDEILDFFSKELPAGFLEECDAGEVYEKFITQSGRLKGLVIGLFTPDLWEYSFVHTWGRPDSVSETEFTEERKIFRKSINFKRAGFNELKKEISAELENIGALSTYIEEGGKGREAVLGLSELEDLYTPFHFLNNST